MSQLSFFPYGQKCEKCHFSHFVILTKKIAKKISAHILIIIFKKFWAFWALEFLKYLFKWLTKYVTEEESKVSKSVNQSFLKEFGKFECPECSEYFVNYNENMCRIFFCNFFAKNNKIWKMAFCTFLAIGEKRKLRHQIPPRYILGHHRQWKFLKKNKNFRTGIFRAASDLRNASEAQP